MRLSTSAKARYWAILLRNCQQYTGSAGLGNKTYQHIGIVIGCKGELRDSAAAVQAITKYATTDAKSKAPADLFDAVLNTHVVRAAWKVEGGGAYFEFWSAYHGVLFKANASPRIELVKLLDSLEHGPAGKGDAQPAATCVVFKTAGCSA